MNSVIVRVVFYVLSPILTALVTMLPGWGVAYADGMVTVHLETLIGAVVAALGISGAVFAKWGIR
jgi:hypothetical protein